MSWIREASTAPSGGTLDALFARIRAHSTHGEVAALWRACAADGAALETLYAQYRALMDDPAPLSHAQGQLLAVVVSAVNGCAYCVAHHGPRLALALGDEALARAVASDYREADLAARDRVLLDYAVALTCEPAERTRADVERVREYGFDDAAILRATAIAAFYNQVNRIVLALGVALEPDVTPWTFGTQL